MLHQIFRHIYRRWLKPDLVGELKRRGLTVGADFKMMKGVIIDWSHCHHITIGDHVTMAPNVHILAHDASTQSHLGYVRIGKVDIGNRVFIGAGSIVLPGVRIGNDVVIGAGSIVSRDVPDNVVACGNPARTTSSVEQWVDKRSEELKACPCFGEEYSVRHAITQSMRDEMNAKMVNRIGFIV